MISTFLSRASSFILLFVASYNGDPIPSMLVRLLLRDKTSEMQLAAAKCLAYLYRGGAMDSRDPRIVNKVIYS